MFPQILSPRFPTPFLYNSLLFCNSGQPRQSPATTQKPALLYTHTQIPKEERQRTIRWKKGNWQVHNFVDIKTYFFITSYVIHVLKLNCYCNYTIKLAYFKDEKSILFLNKTCNFGPKVCGYEVENVD